MAVTNADKSRVLAALTSAALGLPGLNSEAAVPAAKAQGNVQYGFYEESDNRMKVDIYHGDVTLPVSERLEFTFSVDRDTYSGATPAFSLPETMTNQVRYTEKGTEKADAISAASGGATAAGLTTLGGINTFVLDKINATSQEMNTLLIEKNAPLDEEVQASLDNYTASNPNPGFPPTISGEEVINFSSIKPATYGKANMNIGSTCPEGICYQEKSMVIGSVYDAASQGGHIHRKTEGTNNLLQYHADSAGIYLRAQNGEAFSAIDLLFKAPLGGLNTGTGPNDYWEILGFDTAVNTTLSSGNGTNYASRIAYQAVANGFDGMLKMDKQFENINALWIHYRGQPKVPTSDVEFDLIIDNVRLDSAKFADSTPEQIAWLAAYNDYKLSVDAAYEPKYRANKQIIDYLYKKDIIKAYNKFLNQMAPPNTKIKQSFQYQPLETRTQPTFGAKYYFDEALLSLSGGQSTEPDFVSTFGSVNYSHELNNKLTTVSAGYSGSSNKIGRNSGGHSDHHSDDPSHNPTNYPELNATSNFNAVNLGLSQVLSKNSLVQFSANYTNQKGYLSNPYKYVYVRGEITGEEYWELFQATKPGAINWNDVTQLEVVGLELFREVRPDLRNLFSFSSHLNQYLPELDAALHLDYRYYVDDWGINSHTMELKWYQELPWGLTVTPGLRYYSQSGADFFAPYFLAPRADGYYSSDFRLSGFGALSGGLTVSKQFNRGIRLELGMDYYTHQGDLKLGGGGESNYADFSYWMTHANLNVDLSAPGHIFGSGAGDEEHHHHHQEHGAPPPAGIMYGHMMPQADSIMVGYRYSYGNQDGEMLHGSSPANDHTLRNAACGAKGCTERPTEMSMQMHMLDLMYAPTDWLNLMIMPQLMDMNMELETLSGVTAESEHGGGHKVHALGDTLMAAMVKVFEMPGHQMHVGLGVSAPTGSVEETLDGHDDTDSDLQDYGMQAGSGTWDLIPSLTYTGHANNWSWGSQLNGTTRLQNHNDSGYALGDRFQANVWGGYSFTDWLSTSVRGIYTEQGKISGQFNRAHSQSASVDFPGNYGGEYWDVGFGLNLSVPSGPFAGHNLSMEWQQPVAENVNGYQLEREGSLFATWNYMF